MDKAHLENLVEQGLTQREIADSTGKGHTTIRYWLKKYELQTKPRFQHGEDAWDVEKFKELCISEISTHQVILKLGKNPSSASYRYARKLADKLEVELPFFQRTDSPFQYSPDDLFVFGLKRSTPALKRGMVEYYGIKLCCSECGLGTEWNNKPLTLHLDHRDGDILNNLIVNLRFLCPNCHTQTPTYCRNKK